MINESRVRKFWENNTGSFILVYKDTPNLLYKKICEYDLKSNGFQLLPQ